MAARLGERDFVMVDQQHRQLRFGEQLRNGWVARLLLALFGPDRFG
jgi:hypothetical protein